MDSFFFAVSKAARHRQYLFSVELLPVDYKLHSINEMKIKNEFRDLYKLIMGEI